MNGKTEALNSFGSYILENQESLAKGTEILIALLLGGAVTSSFVYFALTK